MGISAELQSHLERGATTLCRAWVIRRQDGTVMGFTDHDVKVTFDGIEFQPNSGMTAKSMSQTTGLSVDNTEAIGALSHDAITEADIMAGRYDGAEVEIWLLNWVDPNQRTLQFKGSLGEISRSGGGFSAELRGLAEKLGQPQGWVYQKPCSAVLADARCGFDLGQPGYFTELSVAGVEDARVFRFTGLGGFAPRWFEAGKLSLLGGTGAGLFGLIKNDGFEDDVRIIELWQGLRADVAVGDSVRLEAGCDRSAETCRLKFSNFSNFRGFPHIPGEDWLMAYPVQGGTNDGGSRQR